MTRVEIGRKDEAESQISMSNVLVMLPGSNSFGLSIPKDNEDNLPFKLEG